MLNYGPPITFRSISTFTPTVTLVGGAGNTVPQYTTNQGRSMRVDKMAWFEVYLFGDGGNEGAGTGSLAIALPKQAASTNANQPFPVGYAVNGGTAYGLYATIDASATVLKLQYMSVLNTFSNFTGDLQNNTSRLIYIHGWYETT